MSAYIDAVKARLAEINNKNNKSAEKKTTDDKAKMPWFKPEMGKESEVRFLPYLDKNNQPFEEILYYNNINLLEDEDGKLKARRILAPIQFGMKDSINDYLNEFQKSTKGRTEQHKIAWKEWNRQKAKPRYYAMLIVRGQEDKGPHYFELSNDEQIRAYQEFTQKDLLEEDIFDPEKGYDFTVSCIPDPTGKSYLGKPVRFVNFKARRKSTKLGTKEQMETWIAVLPSLNLHEYFKKMCPDEEKVQAILENYVSGMSPSSGDEEKQEKQSGSKEQSESDSSIDKAFEGI